MRLFIAVPLPESFKNDLVLFREENKHLQKLRWVPRENYHITGYFIGDIEVDRLEALKGALKEASESIMSFTVKFEAYCPAPSPRNARMIWARFGSCEPFTLLVRSLCESITPFIEKSTHFKKPVPHITLARLKSPLTENLIHQPEPSQKDIPVEQFELWASELLSTGARYSSIEQYPVHPSS